MVAYTAKGFRIFTPRRTNILIAGKLNQQVAQLSQRDRATP